MATLATGPNLYVPIGPGEVCFHQFLHLWGSTMEPSKVAHPWLTSGH